MRVMRRLLGPLATAGTLAAAITAFVGSPVAHAQAPAVHEVDMKEVLFMPDKVTVKAGPDGNGRGRRAGQERHRVAPSLGAGGPRRRAVAGLGPEEDRLDPQSSSNTAAWSGT